MTWAETREDLQEVHNMLMDALKKRYVHKKLSDRTQFINSKGTPFNLSRMGDKEPWNCFVIEYEDTMEDGDLFYPEDYDSFDKMLSDIVEEIEL